MRGSEGAAWPSPGCSVVPPCRHRGGMREEALAHSTSEAGSLASELCPRAVPWARLADGSPEQWSGCFVADGFALRC